ncbi:GIY-YIG nuclease family protein [Clostridium sp. D2Q-11]|uniref:GIY-YIG nuclease family protein n=1 Tax=Anaeromonas frigoriresistens TaxID=2683708 RepID=A0A942Z9Z3_9FIRM|nr:DnaB-like helicase C-terminal domain-containing protein [Anaeromonas frigoriresistens]MBS4539813.1 GIY-YIG nuclease family protein [Anaeromonas frigoriresistens]
MNNQYYIYRFLDNNDNILYIGRTNDIDRRILKEHSTSLGHLPSECYQSIEKIQYSEFKNESEEIAFEAILINKTKPKYNIQFKDEGNFEIDLPVFEWKDYVFPYDGYLKYLKNRKNSIQDIKDLILHEVANIGIDNDFLTTGYLDFDERTSISNSDLILAAGDTSSGKTTYALNICSHLVMNRNKKVLYVNLKEDAEILTKKLISRDSHIPLEIIRNNTFTEEEVETYSKSSTKLYKSNIQFTNLTYENKTIDSIIKVIKTDSYDLIVIDDLQCIVNNKEIYIKDKFLEIMQKFKSLTTDIKTPILLLSGISSDKLLCRSDKRPTISDLEYDSMKSFPDIIKFLYRNELYNEDIEQRNILEVIVFKNRLHKLYVFELVCLDKFSGIYNLGNNFNNLKPI